MVSLPIHRRPTPFLEPTLQNSKLSTISFELNLLWMESTFPIHLINLSVKLAPKITWRSLLKESFSPLLLSPNKTSTTASESETILWKERIWQLGKQTARRQSRRNPGPLVFSGLSLKVPHRSALPLATRRSIGGPCIGLSISFMERRHPPSFLRMKWPFSTSLRQSTGDDVQRRNDDAAAAGDDDDDDNDVMMVMMTTIFYTSSIL